MTDITAGPWVLVVGSHRSGTSAVAGLLGGLGLHTSAPDDRVDWPESNPEHWESLSLSVHDEELLDRLGGSWDAPPELPERWDEAPEVGDLLDPAPVVAAAYPLAGPSVWKDPRVSLLLPYWRHRLPEPVSAVLVWRSPLAVAHSLLERDGLPITDGLALWERYNRSAIGGLDGLDTFVIDYESLIQDPKGTAGVLAGWLGSLPGFTAPAAEWDLEGAAALIASELQHQPGDRWPDEDCLLPQHRELVDRLVELRGGHRPFAAARPGAESGWSSVALRHRRESRRLRLELGTRTDELEAATGTIAMLREQLAATQEHLDATQEHLDATLQYLSATNASLDEVADHLARVYDSTSWKVTKPVRQSATFLAELRGRARRS